jgi:hypothetical protein
MQGCASINYQEGGVSTFFFPAKAGQYEPTYVSALSATPQHRSISMLPSLLAFTIYIHGS